MIILLGIIGLLVGVFLYFILTPLAIGFAIAIVIWLVVLFIQENERTQPLNPKQLDRMEEYDKRLRNGKVSQLELDNIILTDSLVWNMFCKYYADTEFMFDLLHRKIELQIEKLSVPNTKEDNFHLIKRLELQLEENTKQKQEWIYKKKTEGLMPDYYGNHGTQIKS